MLLHADVCGDSPGSLIGVLVGLTWLGYQHRNRPSGSELIASRDNRLLLSTHLDWASCRSPGWSWWSGFSHPSLSLSTRCQNVVRIGCTYLRNSVRQRLGQCTSVWRHLGTRLTSAEPSRTTGGAINSQACQPQCSATDQLVWSSQHARRLLRCRAPRCSRFRCNLSRGGKTSPHRLPLQRRAG